MSGDCFINYEDIKCIFNGVLKSFGDVGVVVTYIWSKITQSLMDPWSQLYLLVSAPVDNINTWMNKGSWTMIGYLIDLAATFILSINNYDSIMFYVWREQNITFLLSTSFLRPT